MNNYIVKEDSKYFINVLKGFAIFLMLWGHSIQYCARDTFDFFQNPVFKAIYSFHMPLFMIISGYLFYFSFLKRDLEPLIIHRAKPLIWTIVVCSAFNYAITYGIEEIYFNHSFSWVFDGYLLNGYKSLWFLWSVLAASIGVSLIFKCIKQIWLKIILLLLWTVVTYAFPNGAQNIYMYPFFVAGFLFAKHKENINKKIIITVKTFCVIVFPVLCCFYIIKTEFFTWTVLNFNLFKYVIGYIGCVAVISAIEFVFNKVIKNRNRMPVSYGISKLGEKSLQIYALSVSLLSYWLPMIYGYIVKRVGSNFLAHNMILYNFVYTVIIAIFYSFAIYLVNRAFEKIKFSKVLFGR